MLNYFDIFELPVGFNVDKKLLRKNYYKLSRANHPDNYTLSSQDDQNDSVDKSAMINEAYKVLKDDLLRIKYTLELSGIKFEEGKESVPQEFLMDVMELNESVFDFKLNPIEENKKNILNSIQEIEDKMLDRVSSIMNDFDFLNPNLDHLELVKEFYLKRKYLNRIESNFSN